MILNNKNLNEDSEFKNISLHIITFEYYSMDRDYEDLPSCSIGSQRSYWTNDKNIYIFNPFVVINIRSF